MEKLLTIWIPTFRRLNKLFDLIENIENIGILEIADVVISDNDLEDSFYSELSHRRIKLSQGMSYRSNPANLSAGANFLRGFEICKTPWLMIVGDDDLFLPDASSNILNLLQTIPDDFVAVKYDSSLFGAQPNIFATSLDDYVNTLHSNDYPKAFNNLCLISNWLFRCNQYKQHFPSAYIGYSSKISHIFPALMACDLQQKKILFSSFMPISHGTSDETWPKAATWYEMVMTLSSFSGFVDKSNRKSLIKLLIHSDLGRNLAKCLRVHQFYGDRKFGINPWNIHLNLALISKGYCLALLISLPILFLPSGFLPYFIKKRLGNPGSFERW